MVEGFSQDGNRRGHQGKRGGYKSRNPREAAKLVHSDAIGLIQTQWRSSVSLVNITHKSIDPQRTVAGATETASSTATSGEKSTNNNKPEGISPLASQYFSDIKNEQIMEKEMPCLKKDSFLEVIAPTKTMSRSKTRKKQ
jgi:hypothetical protein